MNETLKTSKHRRSKSAYPIASNNVSTQPGSSCDESTDAHLIVPADNDFAATAPESAKNTRSSKITGSHVVDALIDRLQDDDKRNDPHAFVVMPFGQKSAPDGQIIDFDAIYEQLVKPAIKEAGFDPFRADEETVSGDILTDMFQELLLADLVIADMSIDNANVFYELGVRHAFRKRGVVHIQSGRAYMPFDVFNVRTMPYHINQDGVPDSAFIDRDRQNLIRITRDTWASDNDAVHSPIFNLLTGLIEPDRRTLRTPLATGFWREFNEWEERIAVARRQKRIGDILLLTEEISNPLCKEDAVGQAGLALRELGRHELALQEYRKGLAVNSKNVEFRREEAVILNRMGRVDEAIIKLERLLADEPSDTNATGCLGRIYTSIWKDCWAHIEDLEERQQAAFDAYQWMVKSIDTYIKGFHFDLNIHEPGIKALNMSCILLELADKFDHDDCLDPDIERIRDMLPELKSTLGLILKASTQQSSTDYWMWASLAEWHLTSGAPTSTVTRAFRKSLSYSRKNIFHIHSSLKQLKLFRDLGLYMEPTQASMDIVISEIDRIESVGNSHNEQEYPLPQTEVLSFAFSGHKLDQVDSQLERFPPMLEDEVRRQIDLALDRGDADSNDHSFVSGAACGGDIIFIEACLDRGMKVHVHMPLTEASFINDHVSFGGETWIERFYSIRNNPRVNMYYQQERVGYAPDGMEPCIRNARWTLFASLVLGIDKLRLIALWDGKTEDADDNDGKLVSGMVNHMHQMGGIVDHINITKLEYLFKMSTAMHQQNQEVKLQIESRVELLRTVSLFANLHSVDLNQIALVMEERKYEDGNCLANQGEHGQELFIIISGEISVRMKTNEVAEKEVARRTIGEHVGDMAVLNDEVRVASLVAVGDVLILVLSQSNFRNILRSRPETSLAVTRMLASRIVEAADAKSVEQDELLNNYEPVLEQ